MTHKELIATARLAGIWYLLLAITGVLGFLVFHPQVYSTDPGTTLENLVSKQWAARVRLILELLIVVSQALAAAWFYKLFKDISGWAAATLGAWGLTNSVVIMVSAISMGVALDVAGSAQPEEVKVSFVMLLSSISTNAWGVGSLFFGLWLLPMGYIVLVSRRMPRSLAVALLVGGIGYLLSAFLTYGGIKGSWMSALTIPATIGEFWMIGYLLIFGIRDSSENKKSA